MLCKMVKNESYLEIYKGYSLFPSINDRKFWDKSKSAYDLLKKLFENHINSDRKFLTASLYREYSLTGNRSNYESVYYQRRCELMSKAILEAFENNGRYLDDIVDLVWMILEESTWTIPAHNVFVQESDSLPDFNSHSLDLFLAETGGILSFVYLLYSDIFDEYSKVINKRIKHRVTDNLIDNYLSRNDYWWMGFGERTPNNWNPWINSNTLIAAIAFLSDDEVKLKKTIFKIMTSLDKYIESRPIDGACDEGPLYWNHSTLTLLDCLWMLYNITNGQINFFNDKKIINMLEYFMKTYTGNGQYVNFADSGTSVCTYYASIYKYAGLTGSDQAKQFSGYAAVEIPYMNILVNSKKESNSVRNVIRMFDIIQYKDYITDTNNINDISDSYLTSTEFLLSKSSLGYNQGLLLSAKGGNNNESHNHNDVGNFILYKNGTKFIVDAGTMKYTDITFSDKRYTLWTTRSAYHNVPQINGKEQNNGKQYKAQNARCSITPNNTVFSLDIKDAYENSNNINKWIRKFEYDKTAQVIKITEDFEFDQYYEYRLNFLTPHTITVIDNIIELTADNGEKLTLLPDRIFDTEIEKIIIDDERLKADWGTVLYRLSLKSTAKKDIINITFK